MKERIEALELEECSWHSFDESTLVEKVLQSASEHVVDRIDQS